MPITNASLKIKLKIAFAKSNFFSKNLGCVHYKIISQDEGTCSWLISRQVVPHKIYSMFVGEIKF